WQPSAAAVSRSMSRTARRVVDASTVGAHRCNPQPPRRVPVRGPSSNPRTTPLHNPHAATTVAGLSQGVSMAVAKVTEITSSSPKESEAATRGGISGARRPLRKSGGGGVKDMKVEGDTAGFTKYPTRRKSPFVWKD